MDNARPFGEVYNELKAKQPQPFTPCAWYNPEGDALEIYLSQEPHISERINTLISVFVSPKDREHVLGFVIKNIKKHFGDAGLTKVMFLVKRATVRLLLMSAFAAYEFGYVRRGVQASEPPPLDERRIKTLLDQLGNTEIDLKGASELLEAGA